ncbi:MAG: geranylgeranyl reductase [Gallionellales bacterium RIFCSPLOWO2_02_FULL_57_47]|nr:MAG: geranylgeranyl reductase [Gallionellales bacterium RIFCSPLOWO2_02_FULL_57_47]OGT10751.1 MAG: geranylgeranyl reductase [Gallionellales bacterium RIFCSPHIGHO2_02_FULL_57_16]
MESCDVLIIGGGPAGSSCAWELRRHGLDVVVMDKATFPRNKVCAGWITPSVVETLRLDTEDYARQHVLQPITAFRTGLIDGRELETRYPVTVSYGIRRSEFDDYLLQRSGARLLQGQAMESIERRGGGWLVNGAITTPLVIGAGGHFCPVARLLGAAVGAGESAVAAKEIEFEMSTAQRDACHVRPDTPELYFCRDMKGYGWCFRKGNYLNVGLGREGSQHLPEQLRHFCEFLKQRGRIPHDTPDKFHGHAYLLYGHAVRKKLDDGMLLVGDAAGLACPQSGEGIRPAVESALMAAATILEARGDYSRQQLLPYASRMAKHFGPVSSPNGGPAFLRNFLAGKLLGNKWFTRHVVLDRWFLQTGKAAMQTA